MIYPYIQKLLKWNCPIHRFYKHWHISNCVEAWNNRLFVYGRALQCSTYIGESTWYFYRLYQRNRLHLLMDSYSKLHPYRYIPCTGISISMPWRCSTRREPITMSPLILPPFLMWIPCGMRIFLRCSICVTVASWSTLPTDISSLTLFSVLRWMRFGPRNIIGMRHCWRNCWRSTWNVWRFPLWANMQKRTATDALRAPVKKK